MQVLLMHRDRDFGKNAQIPQNVETITKDLGLDVILEAMAKGDELVYDVSRKALLASLTNSKEIRYRQEVVKDSIKNPAVIRSLYDVSVEAIRKKREWFFYVSSTSSISSLMSSSVNVLQMFVEMFKKLRKIADANAPNFSSEGFKRFFKMLKEELNNEYLLQISKLLEDLRFKEGMLISAELGNYNQGINYVLRKKTGGLMDHIKWQFAGKYCVHPRDENGGKDIINRMERAINPVANALAQSSDHVLNFFHTLREEIAFYVGCINLYETLQNLGCPTVFPAVHDSTERKHSFEELYDVSLALLKEGKVVGNTLNLDDKELIFITGANQGGKSTFLRSIGQAQLMMQCGMFVGAKLFRGNVVSGEFTHFIKEEDETLEKGKLDEELARMSEIANLIKPNALILFNESFSSTNEREGSEIARQIIKALLTKNIKIFFVTHFFDLANSFYESKNDKFGFLRAERKEGGERTFRILEGIPLETSFGEDLYERIFGLPLFPEDNDKINLVLTSQK